jgi:hypothetical protein
VIGVGLWVGLTTNDKNKEGISSPTPHCSHAGTYCSSDSDCCSDACFYNLLTGYQYCYGL